VISADLMAGGAFRGGNGPKLERVGGEETLGDMSGITDCWSFCWIDAGSGVESGSLFLVVGDTYIL